jgi:hypothetical protein
VSELLKLAQMLEIDLIAERYNVVFFLLEEYIPDDNYPSSSAKIQKGDLCDICKFKPFRDV